MTEIEDTIKKMELADWMFKVYGAEQSMKAFKEEKEGKSLQEIYDGLIPLREAKQS